MDDQKQDEPRPTAGPDEAPGGDIRAGKGRRDEVGRTPVYPASGPLPEGDAKVMTPGEFGHPVKAQPPAIIHPKEQGMDDETNE